MCGECCVCGGCVVFMVDVWCVWWMPNEFITLKVKGTYMVTISSQPLPQCGVLIIKSEYHVVAHTTSVSHPVCITLHIRQMEME